MWAPLLVVACSRDTSRLDSEESFPLSPVDGVREIRVDVLPPAVASLDDVEALPTSVSFEFEPADRVRVGSLDLLEPARVRGTVVATQVFPTLADLPGVEVPVIGTVTVGRRDALARWSTRTADDGSFDAFVVQAGDNLITIVPDDPSLPTFEGRLGAPSANLGVIDLGVGTPVFGRVMRGGAGMAGAVLYAVSEDGARSPDAVAQDDGFYSLQVGPGVWTVTCDGRPGSEDPQITEVVEVGRDGARVDFEHPATPAGLLSGTALDAGGVPLADARIRLRSTSLTGYGPNAAWTGEVRVSGDGGWLVRVPRGTYDLELLPDVDVDGNVAVGPGSASDVLVDGDRDIDVSATRLRETVVVVSDGAAPLADARVSCREIGFEGHEHFAFSRDNGRASLWLPPVDLACEVSPPGSHPELALTFPTLDARIRGPQRVQLGVGVEVVGTVEIGGEVVPSALVQIRSDEGVLLGFDVTDEDGEFSVPVDLR